MKNRIFRKSAVFLLTACLLAGTFGCGGQETSQTSSVTPVISDQGSSGDIPEPGGSYAESSESESPRKPVFINGWRVYDRDDPNTEEMLQRAVAALERAQKKSTVAKYESIALLATQIVSGINYCLFCRETADENMFYATVYVYEDNSGGADIISDQPLLFESARNTFVVNKGPVEVRENPEVAEAFMEAVERAPGRQEYIGLGYLGDYVDGHGNVADHLIFCEVREPDESSRSPLYFATVNVTGMSEKDGPMLGSVSKLNIGA